MVPAGSSATKRGSSARRIAMPVGVESSTSGRVIAAGVGATGRFARSRREAGGGTGYVPCAIFAEPRPGRIGEA